MEIDNYYIDVLQGRTSLHVSAWQGHVEMVALLLTEGGASVNACDNENRTPLHSAAWQGHAAIVRLLLEHAATPDHTCNQGATALGTLILINLDSCMDETYSSNIKIFFYNLIIKKSHEINS